MQILSHTKNSKGKLQIVLEIAAEEADSFLEKEENLAELLNEVGCLATAEMLKSSDLSEQQIQVKGQKYYQKSVQKKSTEPPTETSQ